ncbi:MAG: hypothetical protein HYY61_01295 [Deltaproteobacteria bacterium]|nr:hypothetical protein [Deltaproteobacteria bacterium]
MYRFLILLIFLGLTSCATQTVRIEIDTEKVNLDTLPSSKLQAEIAQKTKQYLAIQEPQSLEKKNMALTLGYLHYQAENFSKAATYFTLLVDAQDYPLKEYAYFYLGRMALEKKKCILASFYQKNLGDHFPETSVLQRLTDFIDQKKKNAAKESSKISLKRHYRPLKIKTINRRLRNLKNISQKRSKKTPKRKKPCKIFPSCINAWEMTRSI